jgi:hypothetical protein
LGKGEVFEVFLKEKGRKQLLFFVKKVTKKTFGLRRGRGEAGISRCEVAAADTGLASPASQRKSFLLLFFKKEALPFFP